MKRLTEAQAERIAKNINGNLRCNAEEAPEIITATLDALDYEQNYHFDFNEWGAIKVIITEDK